MAWVTLTTIVTDNEWRFTSAGSFDLCRVRVISAPRWGRGLIAQASATDPRDFHRIKRLYGNNSEVFDVPRPACWSMQAIALLQYAGTELWTVSVEVWQ